MFTDILGNNISNSYTLQDALKAQRSLLPWEKIKIINFLYHHTSLAGPDPHRREGLVKLQLPICF